MKIVQKIQANWKENDCQAVLACVSQKWNFTKSRYFDCWALQNKIGEKIYNLSIDLYDCGYAFANIYFMKSLSNLTKVDN